MNAQEVQLASYPDGSVAAENFRVESASVQELDEGEVKVRLRRLGLNAGLANRIGAPDTTYGPGIRPGDVPGGDGVVEILESRSQAFAVGDLAVGKTRWRNISVVDAHALRRIPESESDVPLETHLTLPGHVGFTAYTGLRRFGDVRAEDIVYVSGAAGGVGSCVVQFAKALGATVIGSAGTGERSDFCASWEPTRFSTTVTARHWICFVKQLRKESTCAMTMWADNSWKPHWRLCATAGAS